MNENLKEKTWFLHLHNKEWVLLFQLTHFFIHISQLSWEFSAFSHDESVHANAITQRQKSYNIERYQHSQIYKKKHKSYKKHPHKRRKLRHFYPIPTNNKASFCITTKNIDSHANTYLTSNRSLIRIVSSWSRY